VRPETQGTIMSKLGIGFAILALSTSTIVRAQEPRMTVQNSGQINGALLLRHCQRAHKWL
jgi:hypothetical protein